MKYIWHLYLSHRIMFVSQDEIEGYIIHALRCITMSNSYPSRLHVLPMHMMTSSNGNIFRVTGHLCGEFPAQRPVSWGLNVFFDLSLNEQLNTHSWGWWFQTPSHPLWRQSNDMQKDSTKYQEQIPSHVVLSYFYCRIINTQWLNHFLYIAKHIVVITVTCMKIYDYWFIWQRPIIN